RAMTVGAQELALGGLGREPRPRSEVLANGEVLLRHVAVMKLERRQRGSVATARAGAAKRINEALFQRASALLLVALRLRVAGTPPMLRKCFWDECSGRHSRGVVCTERGALQAEAPPVQRSHLSVDDLLRREGRTARFADHLLRLVRHGTPRSRQQAIRTA